MLKSSPKYPYQEDVNTFGHTRDRFGCFTFFGGGKTYLSLHWLAHRERPFPALVLCKTALVDQWASEIAKHTHYIGVPVSGVNNKNARKRVEALKAPADIYVCHYEAWRNRELWLAIREKPWRAIIIDESRAFANTKTRRYNHWYTRFADAFKIPYRAILSGKPTTEDPEELYGQLYFLDDGETFGKAYWGFRKRYFLPGEPPRQYDWVLKPGADKTIARALSKNCIYVPKRTILEQLPPREFHTIKLEMPDATRVHYEELKRDFRTTLPSGHQIKTKWAVVRAAKMHQLCQGFVYPQQQEGELLQGMDCIDGRDVEILDNTKLDWLQDNIEEILFNGPILIWSPFTVDVQRIYERLLDCKIKTGLYSSKVPDHQRTENVSRFQKGRIDVLVLSQSLGHAGLNLQAAASAIFCANGRPGDWRENALDRNHRIGSEIHKKVTYYDLVMERTIEGVILDALDSKRDVTTTVLESLGEYNVRQIQE